MYESYPRLRAGQPLSARAENRKGQALERTDRPVVGPGILAGQAPYGNTSQPIPAERIWLRLDAVTGSPPLYKAQQVVQGIDMAIGTVTLDSSGAVSGVTLLSGGSGYDGTATLSIIDANGTPPSLAIASVTVSGGVITAVTITYPGAGYTNPFAQFSLPTTQTTKWVDYTDGLTLDGVNVYARELNDVPVEANGSLVVKAWYDLSELFLWFAAPAPPTQAFIVFLSTAAGTVGTGLFYPGIVYLAPTNSGPTVGFPSQPLATLPPSYTFTGLGGGLIAFSPSTATATTGTPSIPSVGTAVMLTGDGTAPAYSSNSTTVLAWDTTALGTATLSSGAVSGVTLTQAGSNYTSTPTVAFVGNGTGAAGTAVMSADGKTVTGVTITQGGSGYSGTVYVIFKGGSPATASTFSLVCSYATATIWLAQGCWVKVQNLWGISPTIWGGPAPLDTCTFLNDSSTFAKPAVLYTAVPSFTFDNLPVYAIDFIRPVGGVSLTGTGQAFTGAVGGEVMSLTPDATATVSDPEGFYIATPGQIKIVSSGWYVVTLNASIAVPGAATVSLLLKTLFNIPAMGSATLTGAGNALVSASAVVWLSKSQTLTAYAVAPNLSTLNGAYFNIKGIGAGPGNSLI